MCVEGRLKNIKNLAKNTSLIPFRREELWQEEKKRKKVCNPSTKLSSIARSILSSIVVALLAFAQFNFR